MAKTLVELSEKMGFDLSGKIDRFVFKSLKEQAPFACWVLSKKFFQKRWVAKLLKLELKQYSRQIDKSYILEVLVRHRVIGRAEITDIELVKL